MDRRVALGVSAFAGIAFVSANISVEFWALAVFAAVSEGRGIARWKLISTFYAIGALPVMFVVSAFSGSYMAAALAYSVLVVVNAAVMSIAVQQRTVPVALAIPVALVVLSVPPISLINPMSLLPLAGIFFPGLGYWGLAAFLMLCGVSAACALWSRAGVFALIALSVFSLIGYSGERTSDSVAGIDIVRPYDSELDAGIMRMTYRHEERDLINASPAAVSVLPESVFGEWIPGDGAVFNTLAEPVYGGARRYWDAEHYTNTVVNARSGAVVYEQRTPPLLPVGDRHTAVGGRGLMDEVGFQPLICYELVNPWIAIPAFASAEPVVWLSNLGWYPSEYLVKRMRNVATGWELLFRTPYSDAVWSPPIW